MNPRVEASLGRGGSNARSLDPALYLPSETDQARSDRLASKRKHVSNLLHSVVPPGGLEPPTPGLGNRCSIP